jgi:hypothetical protein
MRLVLPIDRSSDFESKTHSPESEPAAEFGRKACCRFLAGTVAYGKSPDIEFFEGSDSRIQLRFGGKAEMSAAKYGIYAVFTRPLYGVIEDIHDSGMRASEYHYQAP